MADLSAARSLPVVQVWDGVTVRIVRGERMTLVIAELAPGIEVPEHRHPNEQLGVVLQGSARFITDRESRDLSAGGTYRLFADVPHRVEVGPQGAVFVECFAPGRADWDELRPASDVELRWPAAT
jgi:quercetin dioxygenase-like cupin family protein